MESMDIHFWDTLINFKLILKKFRTKWNKKLSQGIWLGNKVTWYHSLASNSTLTKWIILFFKKLIHVKNLKLWNFSMIY
jgi:hypothetical protein